ncbi:uncharacterized protein [Littorina saxatilis]|uniref:Uncharacterized protein n=1 Tax=Littorina saxatilis TaxID=31220 RepID=A0AAN9GGW3_9CAEN
MAGSGQREKFLHAVRDCQWQTVSQLVQQGSSLEQRDVAVSQAVTHSQWGLVSQLAHLGVSQQCRDLAVHKAARYCLWDTVEVLVAAGVSSDKRDFLLQRGLRQRQWALVSRLLSLGVGQEPRGLVVTAALEHGQWRLVLDALRLGVSQELRGVVVTTALEHGQWELVLDTIRLGVSQELRDRVLTKALENGQWGLVLDALRLGVKQELVTKVFQEVVSQKRWEHVPSLVKLCGNNDHTDFVLRKAIMACQWNCVRELVKTGLTPAQQGLVCKEALEWAHFDCAVELLRQGCEPDCAERIVLEALRWRPCWNLVELLREGGSKTKVRDVILRTAMTHGCWTEYVMILKETGATEKEMVELVTTAFHAMNFVVMLQLLSLFASARRVFKQVLLRTRFPAHAINTLHTRLVNDHPDLALHMLTAQEMWGIVVGMFRDARLSRKDKRYALRHAIRKSAWKAVKKMVRSPSTHHSERRYAFLQAARRGKWRLSIQMSTSSKKISLSDKVFALRLWLKHGLWNCLQEVQDKWVGHSGERTTFMKCILEESIIAEKREAFTDTVIEMDYGDTFCSFVFDKAIEHNKCYFIVEFCLQRKDANEFKAAVKLAIEKKNWGLLKNLIEETSDCVDDEWDPDDDFKLSLFFLCVRSILKEEDSWQIVVPALNGFCYLFETMDAVSWHPDEDFRDASTGCVIRTLAAWCLDRSYGNAGLVLSLISGYTGKVTDQLKDYIVTALYTINVGFVVRLFSVVSSGRRVFKQVLLQTRFSDHNINILCKFLVDDHPDLALHMLTAQEMWGSVVGMFRDARLSRKDKRYALRHAVRKSAWKAVRKMVRSPSTHHSERRYAFMQAARRGKWRLSLQMSTSSKKISLSDKVFALRLWLKHGLWNCLQDVQDKWVGHSDERTTFMKCILEESIIAEKLEAFIDTVIEMDYEDTFCSFVFDKAIEHDKCNFIVEFCRLTQHTDDFEAAVQLAIEKKKWGLLKNLIEETSDCVDDEWEPGEDFEVFCLCVRSISKEEDSWQIVVPALNGLCDLFQTFDALHWDPDKDFRDTSTGCLVRNLAAWCLERSYGNACLVLSVISGYTENVTRVIDQLKDSIRRDVLMFCLVVALNLSDWESAVTCLHHLSFAEADTIFDEDFHDTELADLVETCRGRAQYKWVVYLGVYTEDWEQVRTALELCEDTSVVDIAIRKASSEGEWDIVESQLARCSQDNSLLCTIFSRAVEAGQSDMCTDLISKINILHTSVSIQSLLLKAVTSSGDREEMVKLCIEFGLSTHMTTCTCTSAHGCSVCWDCPIKTALNNGQMPLVKLLYQAGACSNKQLFRCKENADLRNQLQGQGRQDIVEYLDHAATTPRILQDLCRLQVSHLIGCHPDRVERVMSLDMPWPAKDLINFNDVLS